MSARSGVGAPLNGCTCLLNQWIATESTPDEYARRTRHWTVHSADPACPHHGAYRGELAERVRQTVEGPAARGTLDDLFDGRMPREDDDDAE